jgi:hypothetical protein
MLTKQAAKVFVFTGQGLSKDGCYAGVLVQVKPAPNNLPWGWWSGSLQSFDSKPNLIFIVLEVESNAGKIEGFLFVKREHTVLGYTGIRPETKPH